MKDSDRLGSAYGLAVLASFSAVALWRRDLFLAVARPALQMLAAGGAPALWAGGQILFFGGILGATLWTISRQARPRRDAVLVLVASLAGWAAERWGTRLGLWSYYTGEQPPLWIVPAWPLGALFVERVAARWRSSAGAAPAAAYWTLAAGAWGVIALFCAPRGVWAGPIVLGAALAAPGRPGEDFWTLAAGACCVLVADYWGVTRACWLYYLHAAPFGLWRGIAFGMAFDASVVLAAFKAERLIDFYLDFSASPTHTRAMAIAERRTS